MGLKERDGELRTMHVGDLKANTIQRIVREHVAKDTKIITDEHLSYQGLQGNFMHHTVNHSSGEYVRHFILHTNGIESVWALLKRQIIGIHHWVSDKHFSRYLSEMTWRFNRRELGEGNRVNALLAQTEGRLTYKALIA